MDSNDVLALVRAGFTKEEIAKMYTAEPKQKEAEKPEQKPTEQPEPKEVKPEPSAIEQKMDKLLDAIANSNFLNAQQPKQETVDDIIANIINPKEG
jgi:hypothetical protein